MQRRSWRDWSTQDIVLESRDGSRKLRTRITGDDLLDDPDAIEKAYALIEDKIRQAQREGKLL